MIDNQILIKKLGLTDYEKSYQQMVDFSLNRTKEHQDELWIVEHKPVYTVGMAGKEEHYPTVNNGIPIVKIDRGGQITYHGEGQLVVYFLIDLKRRNMKVRQLVDIIENCVINLLKYEYQIDAHTKDSAPGVYINGDKICSLGLRIKNGVSYHGLSLNINMDLSPFLVINPCGYQGLKMTQLKDFNITDSVETVADKLIKYITFP